MKKLAIFFLFFMVIGCNHAPDIGERAKLISPDDNGLYIGLTEQAYEAERKAEIAKDFHGRMDLILAHELIFIENKTPVLIINKGSHRRKVRILSGKYEGSSGWVSDEYIK